MMTRRQLKGKKQKLLSKSKSKSTVVEEVNLDEARKYLFEAQFTLPEHKPALQMHSKPSFDRDEDRLGPWYFIHV